MDYFSPHRQFSHDSNVQRLSDATLLLESKNSYVEEKAIRFKGSGATVTLLKMCLLTLVASLLVARLLPITAFLSGYVRQIQILSA